MKKLLPVILVIIGLGAGVGVGGMMRPAPEMVECEEEDQKACEEAEAKKASYNEKAPAEPYDVEAPREFVKLPKQFVVPIIKKERVSALVVLSVTLEVDTGMTDVVFGRAPKLRDAFLQVLFKHANSGGFDGSFTTGQSMKDLRASLNEVAQGLIGSVVHEVLITDLVKQAV